MKNRKGITLIALIITIIVMLILVAVTISILINSGLIDTTKKAATSYKTAQSEEENNLKLEYDGYEFSSIEELNRYIQYGVLPTDLSYDDDWAVAWVYDGTTWSNPYSRDPSVLSSIEDMDPNYSIDYENEGLNGQVIALLYMPDEEREDMTLVITGSGPLENYYIDGWYHSDGEEYPINVSGSIFEGVYHLDGGVWKNAELFDFYDARVEIRNGITGIESGLSGKYLFIPGSVEFISNEYLFRGFEQVEFRGRIFSRCFRIRNRSRATYA